MSSKFRSLRLIHSLLANVRSANKSFLWSRVRQDSVFVRPVAGPIEKMPFLEGMDCGHAWQTRKTMETSALNFAIAPRSRTDLNPIL
jgi:hypothetical protein